MALHVVRDPGAIEQEWNLRLESQADASPFCHPSFIRGLNALFGWDDVLLKVDDEVAAWCTLRKRGPLVDLVVPPLTQFTPILARTDGSAEQLRKSIASLMTAHSGLPYSRLFSIPPSFGTTASVLPLPGSLPPRVQLDIKKTFHVPCSPLEEALSSWSSSHRRTFRHEHERFQFHVDVESAVEIAELTDAAYRRAGSRLAVSPPKLQGFVERLVTDGLAVAVCVRDHSSDLQAGIILLQSREMAWYWIAGSHRGPAMTVLLGRTLDYLHKQGIKSLDFVGANTPAIAEFKRRFGGAEVAYGHLSRRSVAVYLAEKAAKRRRASRGVQFG